MIDMTTILKSEFYYSASTHLYLQKLSLLVICKIKGPSNQGNISRNSESTPFYITLNYVEINSLKPSHPIF